MATLNDLRNRLVQNEAIKGALESVEYTGVETSLKDVWNWDFLKWNLRKNRALLRKPSAELKAAIRGYAKARL